MGEGGGGKVTTHRHLQQTNMHKITHASIIHVPVYIIPVVYNYTQAVNIYIQQSEMLASLGINRAQLRAPNRAAIGVMPNYTERQKLFG